MSQSHRIKGKTTVETFQEQRFLWERGASVGVDYSLFHFQDLLHALSITLKESSNKTSKVFK